MTYDPAIAQAFEQAEDSRLIADTARHGYVFPSVACSECRGPVYFLPGEPNSQESGHYAAHECVR